MSAISPRAALFAAGLALAGIAGGAAQAASISLFASFDHVRIAVSHTDFDKKAVANGFCTAKGFPGVASYDFTGVRGGYHPVAVYRLINCHRALQN